MKVLEVFIAALVGLSSALIVLMVGFLHPDVVTALLTSNLALEAINFVSLIIIIVWTQRAGSRIVDSIAMRLGLRTGRAGKNASPLDKLGELADRYLKPQGEAAGEDEDRPINIEGLGSFKPSEIQALAKKYLPTAKKAIASGELEAPAGLDILKKLATGESVEWADALPWIMKFLGPQSGGGESKSQSSGTNWDS